MKIAIAGLGHAGAKIHLPAINNNPDLTIIGAADPNPIPFKPGFPVFATLEQLLDSTRPEMVVVATPTESHFDQCKAALEHDCHVLCEKPFVENLQQAKILSDLADKRNLRIAVNNEFRFMRIHRAAKSRIGNDDFGELLFVDMQQTFRTTPETEHGWRGKDPRRTCKEFGTHVFDLARFYFETDPISILARMPRPRSDGGPDYLNLIDLRFPDDRYARITLDRLSRGKHRYLDIRLDGEHACIETSLGGKLGIHTGVNTSSRRPFVEMDIGFGGTARFVQAESSRQIASDPLDLFANATTMLLRAFVDSIRSGTEPPCSGRDNISTLALMLAAYDSADEEREINLQDYISNATQDLDIE